MPKRKPNRKGAENKQDVRDTPASKLAEESTKPHGRETEIDLNVTDSLDKKSSKKTIETNPGRSEPVIDKRGDTFEKILSYSGGANSQLQLQEEKDWEDESYLKGIGNFITLDFSDLNSALKCIPFHKRLNLPEDIFSENQISRFISCAANSTTCYSKLEAQKIQAFPEKVQDLKPDLDIVECTEAGSSDELAISFSPNIEKQTENIIESLAACLSMKENSQVEIVKEPKSEIAEVADDLDFLLSLTNKTKTESNDTSKTATENVNVDEWLNSILD